MTEIHFDPPGSDDGYCIDELSQRLLVHLHLQGEARLSEMVEPIGAVSDEEVRARIGKSLGGDAAGLVSEASPSQATIDGGVREPPYRLTDDGVAFVHKHKARMSMPADIEELARKTARLRLEIEEWHQLSDRVEELEMMVEDLTDQLQELDNE